MENDKKDLPKAFCVAPWVHAHVGADGDRRLCCIAKKAPPEFAKLPWAEFSNSEYMKSIRLQMLNNRVPAECISCEDANRKDVYRDLLNQQYEKEIPALIQSTSQDGASREKVRYLDYRSNLCNLKCRTCAPVTSSSNHSHIMKNFDEEKRALFGELDKVSAKETMDFFKDNYAREAEKFCSDGAVDRIYFAGGEPFLEASHLKLLKILIADGRAPQVELFYNTNLCYPQKLLEEWLPLAAHFRQARLLISIDGIGPAGEYIREGLDLNVFEKNLDFLIENKSPQAHLLFDFTLTSLNLFYLKEFADFVISKTIPVQGKLMVDATFSFPLLRSEFVDPDIKKAALTEWKDYFRALPEDHKALLAGLDQLTGIYENTGHKTFWGLADALDRLATFEKLHPDKPGFFEILSQNTLGRRWLAILNAEKI